MAPPPDLAFLLDRAALRRIAAVALACALAGLLYGLLAPKWYRSVLTVVPARAQRGGSVSSLLGGELAGLAGGFDAALGGAADAARIAAVLQSIAVTDAVIERFDLRTRYRERYQETTREELWRHCDVRALAKPNLVQLTCEDKDPAFAQEMLRAFAEIGNLAFRRVSVSSASEEVRFLERRVGELRQQADETAARMREFQERHQIVDLDTQAKAVVSSLAALQAQRIGKQLELDFARRFSARDESTMQQLRSQLGVIEERLRDLEEVPPAEAPPAAAPGRRGRDGGGGLFPRALAVPALRAEYERLYRDRKVAEATLVFALERLESARANEARDVSTFLVLDPPALPTKPSWPRRLLSVAVLGALGLAAGVAAEWWRARRARGGDPGPPARPPGP